MKVQKAVIPDSEKVIWLVIDDNFLPIQPIQSFLTYLDNIERSPNTIRAYAYHLRLFWEFISLKKLDWLAIKLSEMAEFIHWLRNPEITRTIPIAPLTSKRAESSVNTILASVAAFYDYHYRLGAIPNISFYRDFNPLYGKYKKFLYGIGKTKASKRNILNLKVSKRIPSIVTPEQVKQLIDACEHIRDKFLVSLLYETGMRIGQVLGLRHEDIHSRDCVIYVVARENANGACSKTKHPYSIDVSANLMRLYSSYLIDEVQDYISDYVFVNLWRNPVGSPMTTSNVQDLFRRLGKKTGTSIHPHIFRHTHATELLRSGWDCSYIQKRLGHSSIQTTINTYIHLSNDDLKKAYQTLQLKKDNNNE